MNFDLSSDQRQLQAKARSFARTEVAPHVAEMDSTNAYPWPVV
ncbi:MAG: acyl-CoA dehydrogenase family protein, partial [Methyloligellaceae bacterium]